MDTNAVERRRRNRSWPEALKREIVAASLAPGASVSVVARQYDVNANQVFSWRKRYRDDRPRPAGPPTPQLIPVVVASEQSVVADPSSRIAERVEIELAGKYRVRISGNFDGEVLRRVLDVLERR
jgi:transposase